MIAPPAIVLAGRQNPAYLNGMVQPVIAQPREIVAPAPGRVTTAILWGASGIGGLALLAAGVLWFHYGTTVFFEMISAGISACF